MKGKRALIRTFLELVLWATPSNVAYFIEGRCDARLRRRYASELSEMLRVKDREYRVRKVKNEAGQGAYTLKVRSLPGFKFNHDVALRDVLGKWLHDRGVKEISFKPPADATLGAYRFELDTGHMNLKQLEDKIEDHYFSDPVQVLFFMKHRVNPNLERERVRIIFDISQRMFFSKPNKLLAAGYSQYLSNGRLYNRKGEVK